MDRLRWSETAIRSLEEIHTAIARDRPSTARRTLEDIVQRARSLARYPGRGTDSIYMADRAVHLARHGSFRLAYAVDETTRMVTILAVFHGGIFLPR